MQYFMASALVYRTIGDETHMEHIPVVARAASSEDALEKILRQVQGRWLAEEGWTYSITQPVQITALIMAITRGVN